MSDNRFRRLRAVLRNAVTWGAACGVAGGAVVTAIALFSPAAGIESLAERLGLSLLAGIMWGVRFAVAGAVMGTLFSVVVRLGYRGRRLADINPAKFALLGAVVGGAGVPLYLQAMNVLSGGPIPWSLVLDDGVWASVFGAVAAAGSILLARRADALSRGAHVEPLDAADELGALPAAGQREIPIPQRARSVHY